MNVGIIGAGNFAQNAILPSINSFVNFVGIATAEGNVSRYVAEKYKFNYCVNEPEKIFTDDSINTVFVLTRHNLHAQYIIKALEAGKTVFVEKPLAMTEEELEKVKIAYEKSQGRLMLGFNRRFSPLTKIIKNQISDEQIKYATDYCSGLPVKIIKSDYRNFNGSFDKVLVCGMIEHVGYKNHRMLMQVAFKSLKDRGLFLLQTIGTDISARMTDPWINKYIFPNGLIPSAKQITSAAEGLFTIKDCHFLGPHYDRTLMAWYNNFTKNWDRIKSSFDERFFRIWKYYLLSSAGSFRSGSNDLWQIVFSKNGHNLDYTCIR